MKYFKMLFLEALLPLFGSALIMAVLVSCSVNVGGSRETVIAIFVEPGAAAEIATDKKIPVIVKTKDKQEKMAEEKNLAGFMAMPKSVHKALRFNSHRYNHILSKLKPEQVEEMMKDLPAFEEW